MLRWNGASWGQFPVVAGTGGEVPARRAVWGPGEDDVWAAGELGTLAHWDGASWRVVSSGESYSLNDLWGSSATSIWAAGHLRPDLALRRQ